MNVTQLFIRTILMLPLLLTCQQVHAQLNFNGKVLDKKTGEPIVNARIYFDNTTISTLSGNDGRFNLTAQQSLNTTVVIAATGYEVLALETPIADGKTYTIKLQASDNTVVKAKVDALFRRQWLQDVKLQVLGFSNEADHCLITNPQPIYFVAEDNGKYWFYADTPLIIINKVLGYKIYVDILEGKYNAVTTEISLTAFTLYEEIADSNKKKLKENRRNTYLGSSLHFYRSLLANQLQQEGFSVFHSKPISGNPVFATPKDSLLLNFANADYIPITAQQILYIDSTNNFSIRTEGSLLVQYNKNPPGKDYLALKMMDNGFLDEGIECKITFQKVPAGISLSGFITDISNVSYNGYWIYEKLGNNLPYDYREE